MSVEIKQGDEALSREVELSVEAQIVEQKVDIALKEEARTANMPGFRPGKVPVKMLKQRFGRAIRDQVVWDVIKQHFVDVMTEQKINMVGMPDFDLTHNEQGQDIKFKVKFEVYPEIEVTGLKGVKIDQYVSAVEDQDVDVTITSLAKQRATWEPCDGKAQDGDRLIIDFEGFIDNKAFDQGAAEDFEIELGSNQMIAGFESGLIGMKNGDGGEIEVKFPKDYHEKSLADKPAKFKIKVKKVDRAILTEINDEFAQQFQLDSLAKLKDEIKRNMTHQLEENIRQQVKEQLIEHILKSNDFEVPQVLVAEEIKAMKTAAFTQMGRKPSEKDLDSIPDDSFREESTRRVKVGVLFRSYMAQHKLEFKDVNVDAVLEEMAALYQDPKQAKQQLKSDQKKLSQAQEMAMERHIVEHMLVGAKITDVPAAFNEVVKGR